MLCWVLLAECGKRLIVIIIIIKVIIVLLNLFLALFLLKHPDEIILKRNVVFKIRAKSSLMLGLVIWKKTP